MTEESIEKAEKVQIEGIIKEDKVITTDSKGLEEFYESSFIGTIEEGAELKNLVFDPVEVLLLIERHRLLVWENNDKSKNPYDFENMLTYFTKYDEYLWHKYIIYMDLNKKFKKEI